MDFILADLQWTLRLMYFDDIMFGRTFQQHLAWLDKVCAKLQHANLKIKPCKFDFVYYLAHVMSHAEGLRQTLVRGLQSVIKFKFNILLMLHF